jgi:CheY-like chemotaxis protein
MTSPGVGPLSATHRPGAARSGERGIVPNRILFVDDEQRLLDGIRRTLRGRYDVTTAPSGPEGLTLIDEAVKDGDPFAVIVSDMMMPGMNGADFLTKARATAPDASRMILSGQADLTSTIAAVNNADLYRFLTKPIEPDVLTTALDSALRQHQLIVSERELLQNTLTGAVDVLVDVLALASPLAHRRTGRVRMVLQAVAAKLRLLDDWRLSVAAMLSQVGLIAVPGTILERIDQGKMLSDDEEAMFRGHPALAGSLLAKIPRLEEVSVWIADQAVDPRAFAAGEELDDAQAAFACVVAFLAAYDIGRAPREILRDLEATGRFAPRVLDAVLDAATVLTPKGRVVEMRVHAVRPGMVLDEDVRTTTGLVLVRKGERVTEVIAARLENFARSVGIEEPLKVLV